MCLVELLYGYKLVLFDLDGARELTMIQNSIRKYVWIDFKYS